MDRIKLL
uniref:Uncharacterized protein n=1 Tax=Oryza meridionalis TaxID=40149 RepID=A0A1Y8Z588_9ORYZ